MVYQKHACQNKSVLSTHTSVPGECESHSQSKGQHLCRCKLFKLFCNCYYGEIIDCRIFIIDKRETFLGSSPLCVLLHKISQVNV